MLGARGIYFGGYPWRNLGILTADDLNAAIAVAIQEPSVPNLTDIIDAIPDGSISSSKLMYPYIVIGSTTIPLGPGNINTLTGIAPPQNPGDVATKYYVDNVVGLEGYTAGVGLDLIGNQFNIAQTGVVAATYGTPSLVPQFTVNAEGQLTHAGQVAIQISTTQITQGVTGTGPVVLQSGPTIQGVMQVNGNLGIGVQPPSNAQYGLFMGGAGSVVSCYNIGNNLYYDGSAWRYLNAGGATLYGGAGNGWNWLSAPSGPAGGVASLGGFCMGLQTNGALTVQGGIQINTGVYQVSNNASFGPSGSGWVLMSGPGGYGFGVQGSFDPAWAFNHPNGTGLMYVYSSGDMAIHGGLSQGSDENLKTDIAELTEGVSLARRLVPKRFKRKPFAGDTIERAEPTEEWGFIAQDVESVIPQAVGLAPAGERGSAYKTLSPTAITACLSLAVKQLIHRCEALEAHNGIEPPPEHTA